MISLPSLRVSWERGARKNEAPNSLRTETIAMFNGYIMVYHQIRWAWLPLDFHIAKWSTGGEGIEKSTGAVISLAMETNKLKNTNQIRVQRGFSESLKKSRKWLWSHLQQDMTTILLAEFIWILYYFLGETSEWYYHIYIPMLRYVEYVIIPRTTEAARIIYVWWKLTFEGATPQTYFFRWGVAESLAARTHNWHNSNIFKYNSCVQFEKPLPLPVTNWILNQTA